MPDYASILRRSISALPDPTPEMREAVYQRARAALARQLTAVDPPLSSREIEAQHQELEDAVARLEAEYAPQEPPPRRFEPAADEFLFTPAPEPSPAPSPPARVAPPPMRRDIDEEASAEFEPDDDEDEDFGDEEERASRMPALIGLLVVILIVAGIGGYAYSQRDAVFALLGLGPDTQVEDASQARVVPEGQTTQTADTSDKQPDRLTNGTEAPQPAPVPVPPDAAVTPSADAQEMTPPAAESDQTEVASAGTQDQDTAVVAQRAIYYYQGAEGEQGEAYNGSVTWTNVNKDGRPAIRATIGVPDRNVEATVTIYKNFDDSLPASHLVEIEFKGNLAGSPIERVPALVLKQTEQARGQPLAGAAVPVTNDLFWIALSDDAEQVTRNIQLLREGSWFDIPILFSDQTRALLTFEKGIPGDKVFESVMASWTP